MLSRTITGQSRGQSQLNCMSGQCLNGQMLVSAICSLVFAVAVQQPTQPTLDPHLEGLRPFLGKTWKGTFDGPKGAKPTIDVAQYERILNGKAVRIVHSVNDGQYGGESLAYWDETKKQVRYFYLTTAGFYTEGVLTIDKNKFVGMEDVIGDANGITKVRSTSELMPNGHMIVTAEYFANGTWSLGRKADYVVDPKAKPKFK